MSKRYSVMLCDLRRRSDARVDSRVNRAAAERLVRRLNARILAEWTGREPDGKPVPLYFVARPEGE